MANSPERPFGRPHPQLFPCGPRQSNAFNTERIDVRGRVGACLDCKQTGKQRFIDWARIRRLGYDERQVIGWAAKIHFPAVFKITKNLLPDHDVLLARTLGHLELISAAAAFEPTCKQNEGIGMELLKYIEQRVEQELKKFVDQLKDLKQHHNLPAAPVILGIWENRLLTHNGVAYGQLEHARRERLCAWAKKIKLPGESYDELLQAADISAAALVWKKVNDRCRGNEGKLACEMMQEGTRLTSLLLRQYDPEKHGEFTVWVEERLNRKLDETLANSAMDHRTQASEQPHEHSATPASSAPRPAHNNHPITPTPPLQQRPINDSERTHANASTKPYSPTPPPKPSAPPPSSPPSPPPAEEAAPEVEEDPDAERKTAFVTYMEDFLQAEMPADHSFDAVVAFLTNRYQPMANNLAGYKPPKDSRVTTDHLRKLIARELPAIIAAFEPSSGVHFLRHLQSQIHARAQQEVRKHQAV